MSTSIPEVQKFFDQGLRFIYAFNHREAARSFRRAAELDPTLAMSYWGIAEAVGLNYNDPANDERFKQAHEAIMKGVALSAYASASEQAYIQAMAVRFPGDSTDRRKAAEAYHDAMRLVTKKFHDDLDAATLFAESGMNLHPWGLWLLNGTPREGTEEIVATLESMIKYIHAVEASRSPERALDSSRCMDLQQWSNPTSTSGRIVFRSISAQGQVCRTWRRVHVKDALFSASALPSVQVLARWA